MNEALRKLMLRQSELRERINNLAATTDRTEGQAAELRKARDDANGLEVELRQALAAAGDEPGEVTNTEDAETRERRELRSRTGIGHFLAAAVNGTPLLGEASEYAAACGCGGGLMPLDMLMTEARQVETRAVTPGVTAPGATAPIAPVLFQRTAAVALGVQFPTVEQGEAHYPIMTTAPTAAAKAKDAAAPATAGAFRLDTRKPVRLTGQFTVRVEDLALLPNMEEALRMSLDEALGDVVDAAVFNGTAAAVNTDGEIRGLFVQATDVAKEAAVVTFDSAVATFASLVDGTHATAFGDLRAVIGTATFAKLAATFRGTDGDTSAYAYLMGMLGGLRVSSRIPAVASKGQKGLVAKTAGSQPIRVPTWRGVQFVRDPFSDAGKGQITITAYLLIGDPHLPYGTNTVVEVHPQVAV